MKFSHLPRIYTSVPIAKNQTIIIESSDFHYLKSVIRVRKNETFRLFNSQDGEFLVTVKSIGRAILDLQVEERIRDIEQEDNLILALCLIKQDRMIEAIKAAVQIGVTKIIPVISERTQYKKISREKIERCIIQSVEQSERFVAPVLDQEIRLIDLYKNNEDQQIIFACESEDENNKIINIETISQNPIILIGSEGGFSDQEINMIKSMKNTCAVSLGRTVLRTEVAVASALSCVSMVRK